jgi:hypothetical protein
MSIQRDIYDGRGVSESIGFMLIFTIVIAGIGLVTLYGMPMLLQQQTGADEKIMEKNMIVLQNDFKSITYKTVPFKETSMKIASGALTVNKGGTTGTGPTFCIGDTGGCGPGYGYMPNNKTGDLRYLSSQSQAEISLQNGAVVKRDLAGSTGSVMLAQPRWFYDPNTMTLVINIVTVNSSSLMSREGIGTVQMELGETDYQYITGLGAGTPVRVIYTPGTGQDYSTAWNGYFTRTLNMNCVGTSPMICNTNPATNAVTTLVIKRTDIVIRSV